MVKDPAILNDVVGRIKARSFRSVRSIGIQLEEIEMNQRGSEVVLPAESVESLFRGFMKAANLPEGIDSKVLLDLGHGVIKAVRDNRGD